MTESDRYQNGATKAPDVRGEIPSHIAIIMDGNGRWAQRRGLPRMAGHQAGVEAMQRVVRACSGIGVTVVTLYTFSTENWRRPQLEVDFLLRLAEGYALRELDELQRNSVRLQHLGRRDGLPPSLLAAVDQAVVQTQHNTGLILNLALNYGGRTEIVDAVRSVVVACQRGELDPACLDEASFSHHLCTSGLPDPQLVIRTAGEKRLSNFLIWQVASGAFFWSTSVLWPDFTRQGLLEAIAAWRLTVM
jgi:undecaprenyl diphosphate synthase